MATLGKNDFIRDGKAYVSKNGEYAGKTRFAICELMIKNKERFVEGRTSSGRKLMGISIEGKPNTYPFSIVCKSDTGNKTEVIPKDDLVLEIDSESPEIVLVTCVPSFLYHSRLLVHAKLIGEY